MKHEIESFIDALQTAFGPVGTLKCSPTVLTNKCPDANISIRKFALLFGVDYNELQFGGDKGVKIKGRFQETQKETTIHFYRTKSRGDYRIWISGLENYARPWDIIAMRRCVITGALIINATKETGAENET